MLDFILGTAIVIVFIILAKKRVEYNLKHDYGEELYYKLKNRE